MKIIRIETIPIKVPIKPELAIRSGRGGAHASSPFLLIKIHTDEGIIGLGEVSCTPRWSGEDQFTAAHFINHYLAPILAGEDPTRIETVTAKFRLAMAGNFFTKAGVEMALWDILGKSKGQPLYQVLGGLKRKFIPTKWSVSGVVAEKAAEIATWAAGQGFKTMKVKVGIDPDQDVSRVQAVREAVGPDIKLGVDANGGWSPEEALRTIERLEDFNIAFVEQPVAPNDPLQMAQICRKISQPVIADESLWSLADAKILAHLKAADVFSIYLGKAGGIGASREIAAYSESVHLTSTLGSNLELGIGTAAMIHFTVATPGIDAEAFPCDIIGPFFYADDLLETPLAITGGGAQAPSGPGLGVVLDEEKVERYRVK